MSSFEIKSRHARKGGSVFALRRIGNYQSHLIKNPLSVSNLYCTRDTFPAKKPVHAVKTYRNVLCFAVSQGVTAILQPSSESLSEKLTFLL